MTPALSAVVAVHGDAKHLAAWLDAVRPQIVQCAASVEVLVCHPEETSSRRQGVREVCADSEWVRCIPGNRHALVPHSWRDGIAASRASRVSLGVVDCIPDSGWLKAVLAADLETYGAIGGAIDCDPQADGVAAAIYLLRYARYGRPFARCESADLPGDNALYPRAALAPHSEAYAEGFWEPEIHARLQREGRRLLREPAIVAIHRNAYGAFEFAAQRLAHGRQFGRDRARAMPTAKRALYLVLSPAAPLVLGAKVLRTALARPETRRALPRASLALTLFLLAWGLGELRGVFDALRGRAPSA